MPALVIALISLADPSALAHPARGDQAPCRHRRRDTEHHLGIHSDPPEQRRPRPGDRPDLLFAFTERGHDLERGCDGEQTR